MVALGQMRVLWPSMEQASSSSQRSSLQTRELLTRASRAGMRYSHLYSFSPTQCSQGAQSVQGVRLEP